MVIPSEEQQLIIDEASNGKNIIVNAVAGSGKTTTVLLSMKNFTGLSLLLTYNSRLKFDTRLAVLSHEIPNLEVHSYNSFGVKYISEACKTDSGFINEYIIEGVPQYDRIYIDEVQDCTNMYFIMIKKLLLTQSSPQIFVLGDIAQNIFAFKGSDSRYLSFADKIFPSDRPWVQMNLRESYRLTNAMAGFMNSIIGDKKFISSRVGPKVKLIITNPFAISPIIKNMIKTGTPPGDIFVLGYSTNSPNGPLRKLENNLVGIPRIALSDDAGYIDDEIIKNKLVISSFHRVKGLGRPKVIMINFDEKYYDYDSTSSKNSLPNPLYVGLTRANQELIIVQSKSNNPFKWLKFDHKHVDVIGESNVIPSRQLSTQYSIGVREFIKFISADIETELRSVIDIKTISAGRYSYDIPRSVNGKQLGDIVLKEAVEEITGIAIPSYVQYKMHKVMQIYADLINNDQVFAPIDTYANVEKLLKLSVNYWTMRCKYSYKKEQIVDYNWVTQEQLDNISSYIIDIIGPGPVTFETNGSANLSEFGKQLIINGYADCITNDSIYEIKCSSGLSFEHAVQLLVYAWIFDRDQVKSYKLLNALTGEIQLVTCSDMKKFMSLLVKNKSKDMVSLTDDEFIDSCK